LSHDLLFLGIARSGPSAETAVFLSRVGLHEAINILDDRHDCRRVFLGLNARMEKTELSERAVLIPPEHVLQDDLEIRWNEIEGLFSTLGPVVKPEWAAMVYSQESRAGRKASEQDLRRLVATVVHREEDWPVLTVDGIKKAAWSVAIKDVKELTPVLVKVLSQLMQSPDQDVRIPPDIASDRSIRRALQAVDPQQGSGRDRRRWFFPVDEGKQIYRFSPGDDDYYLILPL
jgi:hypothetical protein